MDGTSFVVIRSENEKPQKYEAFYVREIRRYVFIDKHSTSQFFPSGENVGFIDFEDSNERESVVYLTPLFWDDDKNDCFDSSHKPTGKCIEGTLHFKQRHYYDEVMVDVKLQGLRPGAYHYVRINNSGVWDLLKLYRFPELLEGTIQNPTLKE